MGIVAPTLPSLTHSDTQSINLSFSLSLSQISPLDQMDATAQAARVTQFIRNLAFATPQQQEQMLQRVSMMKRPQILLRAQQMRQQIQQQQQQLQQQNYNPGGGGGGMIGTGGIAHIVHDIVE